MKTKLICFILTALSWFTIAAQPNKTEGDYSPIINSTFGKVEVLYQQIPDSALFTIVTRAVEESFRSFQKDQRNTDGVIESQQRTIETQANTINTLAAHQSNDQVLEKIDELVHTYTNLKEEFAARGSEDELTRKAERLLDLGRFEEAEQVLEQDVHRDNKKVAYKNYLLAETKSLNLKYAEAKPYYQAAAALPPIQFKYLNAYGNNLLSLGQATEATAAYESALEITGLPKAKKSTLFNNLGSAWKAKGEHDRAIEFLEKSLAIDTIVFGLQHPKVATDFNNLGLAWKDKGEYDRAIEFYEKSLAIDTIVFGFQHPKVATNFNNLGSAWSDKGEFDRAIEFLEKSLAIDTIVFGLQHPTVATYFNNLGLAWYDKGEFDRAIEFYEKSLAIDTIVFGFQHPKVATDFNNLGSAWKAKGEYDRAIECYEKSLILLNRYLPAGHPNLSTVNNNLARTHNAHGMFFYQKARYDSARINFQYALEYAKKAGSSKYSLTCYNNLAGAHRHLHQFEEALDHANQGLSLGQQLDEQTSIALDSLPDKLKQQPNFEAYKQLQLNTYVIHRLKFHKACSLKGLGRTLEQETLVEELQSYAIKHNDERMLADLRKVFGN